MAGVEDKCGLSAWAGVDGRDGHLPATCVGSDISDDLRTHTHCKMPTYLPFASPGRPEDHETADLCTSLPIYLPTHLPTLSPQNPGRRSGRSTPGQSFPWCSIAYLVTLLTYLHTLLRLPLHASLNPCVDFPSFSRNWIPQAMFAQPSDLRGFRT